MKSGKPFIHNSLNNKTLGINLTKGLKVLNNENYKHCSKKAEEDTTR
jgi:hypothetical protein